MKSADLLITRYLEKHPVLAGPFRAAKRDLAWIVVVPVYREEAYLFDMLDSVLKCNAPVLPGEVILVFNTSSVDEATIVDEQRACARKVRSRYGDQPAPWLTLLVAEAYDLPRKHFGAGWARKIGMDIACARLLSIDNPMGVILTLDADVALSPNYFTEVTKWFAAGEDRQGAAVYFEHPIDGNDFEGEVYKAITLYELHLRYYLQALRYVGFPYAFHTMGSAMAVRAVAYARIGGMPRKQAGEDFYFLQKLIPLGVFGEINTTVVYPSPRPSDRVIFGTGAAISNHLKGADSATTTYHIKAFDDLKVFFDSYHELYEVASAQYESWTYKLSGPVRSFLLNSGFFEDLDRLKAVCGQQSVFNKRFFELFNSFKVVKYLNYVEAHFYDRMPVFDAAMQLLENMKYESDDLLTDEEMLQFYRRLERNHPKIIG
ncbi:glycosyltransferase [Geofilum sp. OHC36d9]|uniref:glycosyltransferase n=1 Tax=Geofilum sp. OHC36d9 TaxID=3458413 RepID=UPI0040333DAB